MGLLSVKCLSVKEKEHVLLFVFSKPFLVTGSGDTSLWLSTRQTAFNDTDFFALFSLSSVVHLGHEASGCCPVFNLLKPR